jgi:hypothetical protein
VTAIGVPPSTVDHVQRPPASSTGGPNWGDWVSATRLRNHVLGDPLLDWLELHGETYGFQRDHELPGYDPRTDFSQFIMAKGREFEAAVLKLLRKNCEIVPIGGGPQDSRDLSKAAHTLAAMKAGVEAIHCGVLHDESTRTYGMPDLLVRADVLERLFPSVFVLERDRQEEGDITDPTGLAAPVLGGRHHYRVVDIKFTSLKLSRSGELGNEGSRSAYKAQLYLYNRALGHMQGLVPPAAFLLGRSWKKGKDPGIRSCFDRLAPVFQSGTVEHDAPLAEEVERAIAWVRRVRNEGSQWSVDPEPVIPELRPNMKHLQDSPWHAAKKRIAVRTRELTSMWFLGAAKRNELLARPRPITRWDDPELCSEVARVRGEVNGPRFDAVLDVNREPDGPPVRPVRVSVAEGEWRRPEALEFFVDFETVNDCDDDFSHLPERGGQPLIFMIGCGHVEGGQFVFRCFTTDALNEPAEAEIIDRWLAHMEDVKRRMSYVGSPRVFHWSPAEDSAYATAYNSAKERHPDKDWPDPRLFDFLNLVVRKEPVVVRGALGFGLKLVGKALHAHGLIATCWSDGPTDGLGAMAGAWSAAQEARDRGVLLTETELMREIERYNQVDCRVMYEVISYLRGHH